MKIQYEGELRCQKLVRLRDWRLERIMGEKRKLGMISERGANYRKKDV